MIQREVMTNEDDNLFQSLTIDCGEAQQPPTTAASSALTPLTPAPSRADSDEEEDEVRALLPVSHTNHNQGKEDRLVSHVVLGQEQNISKKEGLYWTSIYRVTIQVVTNLLLTSKQKFQLV